MRYDYCIRPSFKCTYVLIHIFYGEADDSGTHVQCGYTGRVAWKQLSKGSPCFGGYLYNESVRLLN